LIIIYFHYYYLLSCRTAFGLGRVGSRSLCRTHLHGIYLKWRAEGSPMHYFASGRQRRILQSCTRWIFVPICRRPHTRSCVRRSLTVLLAMEKERNGLPQFRGNTVTANFIPAVLAPYSSPLPRKKPRYPCNPHYRAAL